MNSLLTADVHESTPVENARRFFRHPDLYLSRNYRIPLRARIVRELLGDLSANRILDLGCGDGSISTQFLPSNNRLTLVDYSPGMLEMARSNVPADYQSQVECVQSDILGFEPSEPYDAVLCIGVLAHVDSIDRTIEKLARCVKPGGRVVIQLTDDDQALVRASKWVYGARNAISRSSLRWTGMTLRDVVAIASAHGLEVMGQRRHLVLLFPGMARLLGRWLVPYDVFMQRHPMLARLGSNVILVCRKRPSASEA